MFFLSFIEINRNKIKEIFLEIIILFFYLGLLDVCYNELIMFLDNIFIIEWESKFLLLIIGN